MNMENYNYWNDSRVVSAMTTSYWKVVKVGSSSCVVEFNEDFFEDLVDHGIFSEEDSCRQEYSGTWQICSMCQGSGTVVNPSIDAGGITDWDDWHDDEQDLYFSGRYDVHCPECRGSGKVLSPKFPEDIQSILDEWDEDAALSARERASELSFGC